MGRLRRAASTAAPQASPTMYQEQIPADGLSASIMGGPSDSDAMGLQPVPHDAPLAQRAAAACSDGHAINLAAVLINVVITSLVLTHMLQMEDGPWYGIGGVHRRSVAPVECSETGSMTPEDLCAYTCSNKYVVAALESSLILQTDPGVMGELPPGCTCAWATLPLSESMITATGTFSDGTSVEATLSSDRNTVTVVAGRADADGHCTGIYQVDQVEASQSHDSTPYSESSTTLATTAQTLTHSLLRAFS